MSKRKIGASPQLGAPYSTSDVYTQLANEFNVTRNDVKDVCFPFFYSFRFVLDDSQSMLTECRTYVKTALAMGLIKPIPKVK